MRIKGSCFYDCWDACGILFEKEGEKLKISPDPDNPYSNKFLCHKIYRFLEERKSKNRIYHPLIKDRGEWKRISWDDVFDILTEKLKDLKEKNKNYDLYFGLSFGNVGISRFYSVRFFSLFGGVTFLEGSLCDDAGERAQELDFGECVNHLPEDILYSKTAIIWGRNPADTNIHFIPFIQRARERGTFVYLIDPIKTKTANFVDKYISIKPGKDIYFALALAKIILINHWEDRKFIEEHTRGFDSFLKILENYSLKELLERCDISLETAQELARRYAQEKPSSIWLGMGLQHYSFGLSTVRVIDALSALTGNLGIKGGGVSFSHHSSYSFDLSWVKPYDNFKYIPKAVITRYLEEKIPEVIWLQGFNILNQTQDTKRLKEVWRKIPFKVVIDWRWNDTTKEADLILPSAIYLEKEDIRGSYWHNYIGYLPKIFEPEGEALPENKIYKILSERLGFSAELGEEEEFLERSMNLLKSYGIDLKVLKEKGTIPSPLFPDPPFKNGLFKNEDKKFHFVEEIPNLSFNTSPEFPFYVISPKSSHWINSQIPLKEDIKIPICFIHPIWKKYYPYDEVYLVSKRGKVRVKLIFDERVRIDTLCIPIGPSGINDITEPQLAEDGKGACFYENFVRIEI